MKTNSANIYLCTTECNNKPTHLSLGGNYMLSILCYYISKGKILLINYSASTTTAQTKKTERRLAATRETTTTCFISVKQVCLSSYFSSLRRSSGSSVCGPGTASAASCPRRRSSEGFQDVRTPCREKDEQEVKG